jgi:hypothetical protein
MGDGNALEVAGAIGIFVLLTTVITVTIWQIGSTWRAKLVVEREHAYRELAESAVRAQQDVDRRLAELADRLSTVDTRMVSVERILKEVE